MIYCDVSPSEPLSQGDILDECPLLFWQASGFGEQMEPVTRLVRVVVLTQACDVAQIKANRILVACVHIARELVERNVLKGRLIRDQIRSHRVYGWYFLPAGAALSESIVDLRDLHTIPRTMLENLIQQGKRLTRIATPYREHLAQHFSATYARIGLPEPYETAAE